MSLPKKIPIKTSKKVLGMSDTQKNTLKNTLKKEDGPKEIQLRLSDKKKFFDLQDSILNNLRFTDVSLYSSTPTDQAKYTTELLLNYYSKEDLKTKILMDATACIGGNTWVFADYVKQVIANELSKLHAEILENNMKAIGKNNIDVSNDNYLNIYLTTKQDIIFFDPPWGGVDYKQASEVEIQLLDVNGMPKKLDEIILGLLQYRCETLLLKLPVNYPIKKITDNCTFVNIDDLVINAIDGKPLYRLVVLSHLPRLSTPITKTFPRLGYKTIVPI